MEGLVNKYKKAIEELYKRINFYMDKIENNEIKEDDLQLYYRYITFYEGKIEAFKEVLQGKDINYYL